MRARQIDLTAIAWSQYHRLKVGYWAWRHRFTRAWAKKPGGQKLIYLVERAAVAAIAYALVL